MKPQIDFKEFEQFLKNEFQVKGEDTELFRHITEVIENNPSSIQELVELYASIPMISTLLSFNTGIEIGMRYMAYQFNTRQPGPNN